MSISNSCDDKQISRIELQNSFIRVEARDKQMAPKSGSDATQEFSAQLNMSSSGFGSMEEQSMSGSDQIKVIPTNV